MHHEAGEASFKFSDVGSCGLLRPGVGILYREIQSHFTPLNAVFLNGGGTAPQGAFRRCLGGAGSNIVERRGVEVPLGGISFKASLHQRFTTIQVYTLNYL